MLLPSEARRGALDARVHGVLKAKMISRSESASGTVADGWSRATPRLWVLVGAGMGTCRET